MSMLAFIPARGGSKGIPRKNIRLFCGKPLLQWSIDAALESSCVDRVLVSTDDREIADIAIMGGAEVPFLRPPELATDATPGISPVLHALGVLDDVKDVLVLQPTSPLRISADIDSIVELRQRSCCESAVSLALTSKHPSWMYSLGARNRIEPLLPSSQASCRQELPPAYVLNGALYLASRDFLLREKSFVNSETVGYIMPPERSIDIDDHLDWCIAELLKTLRK